MRVLAVGVATLDIVNHLPRYPREDEEVRVSRQRLSRGGNATNTLAVLSQLGHECSWAGTLAEEPDSRHILADLDRHRIDHSHCVRHAGGKAPTSYITLSEETGSRTILHYRELPEYDAEDFLRLPLEGFHWVHFEGRNPSALGVMLERVRAAGIPCSLEVEKPRRGIEALFCLPDLLLFSRGYAESQGMTDAASLLREIRLLTPDARLFCAWGEQGAWALDGDQLLHQPALALEQVVDSLGAGDVFNAAVIDACLHGRPVAECLQAACELAGRSCTRHGLAGLVAE